MKETGRSSNDTVENMRKMSLESLAEIEGRPDGRTRLDVQWVCLEDVRCLIANLFQTMFGRKVKLKVRYGRVDVWYELGGR